MWDIISLPQWREKSALALRITTSEELFLNFVIGVKESPHLIYYRVY